MNKGYTIEEIEEMGYEYYKVVEDTDYNPCEKCLWMHGKGFRLEEYEPGVTAPPFHPNISVAPRAQFDTRTAISAVRQFGGRVNCRGWIEPASRDDMNDFNAGVLGRMFGMKKDESTGMIYHTKKYGDQEDLGFADWMDYFSKLLFTLHAPKTVGSVKFTEKDGSMVQRKIEHRVWIGSYSTSEFGDLLLTGGNNYRLGGYYGGESSILFEDDTFFSTIII